MGVHDRVISRQDGSFPRSEATAINNTGRDLTAADIGGLVLLDWLPSGSNLSAINPSSAALIATYRKGIVIDLLSGAGKVGKKIRVLLQGEDQALVATGVANKDPLVVGATATSGTTSLASVTAVAAGTVGTYTQGVVAAALAANASGSVTLTNVFFDGSSIGAAFIKD